jgi:hypothetical protein
VDFAFGDTTARSTLVPREGEASAEEDEDDEDDESKDEGEGNRDTEQDRDRKARRGVTGSGIMVMGARLGLRQAEGGGRLLPPSSNSGGSDSVSLLEGKWSAKHLSELTGLSPLVVVVVELSPPSSSLSEASTSESL